MNRSGGKRSKKAGEWGHIHIASEPGCCGSFARRRRSNWRRLSAFSPGGLFQSAFGQTNPATPSTAMVRCGSLRSMMLYDPPAETLWEVSQ